jgi:transcriptional regulator with XRE-family HTH domain
MTVGAKLRKLRNKTLLSQQDVADFIGVDRKTYINWENEINDIKAEYIPKLAEKLGVEIKDLFEDSTSTNIKQEFHESTFHSSVMIMMVTDKKMMSEVLKVLKQENQPVKKEDKD